MEQPLRLLRARALPPEPSEVRRWQGQRPVWGGEAGRAYQPPGQRDLSLASAPYTQVRLPLCQGWGSCSSTRGEGKDIGQA